MSQLPLPTTQQVEDYVGKYPGCTPDMIADNFKVLRMYITRDRSGYTGVFANPNLVNYGGLYKKPHVMSQPPTTKQVEEYVRENPGCTSHKIAVFFKVHTKYITRNRNGYVGVYSNPKIANLGNEHFYQS